MRKIKTTLLSTIFILILSAFLIDTPHTEASTAKNNTTNTFRWISYGGNPSISFTLYVSYTEKHTKPSSSIFRVNERTAYVSTSNIIDMTYRNSYTKYFQNGSEIQHLNFTQYYPTQYTEKGTTVFNFRNLSTSDLRTNTTARNTSGFWTSSQWTSPSQFTQNTSINY